MQGDPGRHDLMRPHRVAFRAAWRGGSFHCAGHGGQSKWPLNTTTFAAAPHFTRNGRRRRQRWPDKYGFTREKRRLAPLAGESRGSVRRRPRPPFVVSEGPAAVPYAYLPLQTRRDIRVRRLGMRCTCGWCTPLIRQGNTTPLGGRDTQRRKGDMSPRLNRLPIRRLLGACRVSGVTPPALDAPVSS
jgi:hypothetical protein